jgi:hypothetical protein
MAATISRDGLKAKVDHGEHMTLLETLPQEYYRRSHLSGALNLPCNQVQQRAPVVRSALARALIGKKPR